MAAKPEFCEIFIPHINSLKMRIKDGFLATLRDRVPPKRVVLRNSVGKAFNVEVSKDKKDGRLYFDRGWDVFVEKNDLDVGYVMLFRYDGGNEFDVRIYDNSGCEKYICENEIEDGDNVVDENGRDAIHVSNKDVDEDDPIANRPTAKAVPKPSANGRFKSEHRQRLRNKVISLFKPKNPYFIVEIQERHLTKYTHYAYVPRHFANAHLNKCTVHCIFVDPAKKKWRMKLVYSIGNGNTMIYAGWKRFVKGINLAANDICLFELISSDPMVFKVYISRAEV